MLVLMDCDVTGPDLLSSRVSQSSGKKRKKKKKKRRSRVAAEKWSEPN